MFMTNQGFSSRIAGGLGGVQRAKLRLNCFSYRDREVAGSGMKWQVGPGRTQVLLPIRPRF